jgi:hypothetical protein
MADYDEQLERLQERAEEASEHIGHIEEAQWPDVNSRSRLREVLAYVQLVLASTDGALVAPALTQELEESLGAVVNAPQQVFETFPSWLDTLLARVARLPTSRERDIEQEVKSAAVTFQRSAQQRFNALQRQTETVRSEVEGLASQLIERQAEIGTLVEQFREQQTQAAEERLTQLDARSQEIQATVERHAQSIDALLTEQAEAFRRVQDERTEEHRVREHQIEASFADLENGSRKRVEALMSEIDAMKMKSAEMVGAIGITGTAERYGKEFDAQQKAADDWRRITLVLGVVAVAVALLAAFDHHATTAGTKVAIALLVSGVAAYTASQSSRHRKREEHARQLQLDLTAFPVFIEPLPSEAREAATVWMAERSFLGAKTSAEEDEDSGPGLLAQAIARRKPADAD